MSKKVKCSKSNNKNKKRALKKIKTPAKISFLNYLGDVQGCGTIRVIYPYLLLNHFRMKDVMVNSTYLSQYVKEPDFYKGHTFVQFQRSASEHHLSMYHHFRTNIQTKVTVPLIYEIDDMLFDIPKWNFAHDYYNKFGDHVKTMISMANAVVVSTENLKKVYSEYNKNISVISNHLPKFVWGDIYPAHEYYREGSKIKILWAGSQNHFSIPNVTKEEGGDFGKELVKFIKKTADVYEWHFQGAWPLELNDIKSKIHLHGWEYIFNYPKAVKAIEPDICIAPLEDLGFNDAKSNIKALEYVALGAPSVFSDVEPYSDCNLKAKTDEEMISYIEKLANDINYRAKIFKKDKDKVRTQLFWEEHDNVKKYINTYLNMFGHKL